MPRHSLRADLLMLLTAAIWGSSYIAQRIGMDHIGPFLYTGLRFSLASLVLLPVILLHKRRTQPRKPVTVLHERRAQPRKPIHISMRTGGLIMGLALTLGINLQQVGLLFTSVTNSGFIAGLCVIIVPLLGLCLGRRYGLGIWLGAGLAVMGIFLLSVGEGFQVVSGDWLQLAGAFVWAVHVLLVDHFARRHDPLQLALIQFIVCALISLLLALMLEPIRFDAIQAALPAVLYGGLLGVAVGFTLQMVAQQNAIASHAAIILSLEAVFAALLSALLLGEILSLKSYFGCALMFSGMLLARLWPRKPDGARPRPAETAARRDVRRRCPNQAVDGVWRPGSAR